MTCLDCGRPCSGRRCCDCQRDRRWEDEFERTLDADDADEQDQTDARTDGGAASKYVIDTGAGYHTTRRVGKGSVAVTLTDTDLGWSRGASVQIGVRDAHRLVAATTLPPTAEQLSTTTVTSSQYRSPRIRVPLSALHEIGVDHDDEIRVYEDRDPAQLVIVDAADDPRVDRPGGEAGGD